jgi:hypothetical protein
MPRNKKYRGRDAVTGGFVSLEEADANPRETVVERRKRPCSGCAERQEIIDRLREEIAAHDREGDRVSCQYVYTRTGGGITGRVCGKPESAHCAELWSECLCGRPHHPYCRRAGKRCEKCQRPIERAYSLCKEHWAEQKRATA